MWEGGSRVPFIASSSSIFAKEPQSRQMICFSDMLATSAELVDEGVINKGCFYSHSFLPILKNPNYNKSIRNELIIEKNTDF